MESPNSTFTAIVTTTLREHKKELADNVTNHNALLQRLTKKGKIQVVDGGYEIVCPLEYAENSTYQRLTEKAAFWGLVLCQKAINMFRFQIVAFAA